MLSRDPAKQWESYGRLDPYYAMVVVDDYHRESLTPERLDRFYARGEADVEALLSDVGVQPRSALDFGCGTGRVLIALARQCEHVVGVDTSRAMLEECRRACASRGIVNVTLTDEIPDGVFDLVHTVFVIQHIPLREGYHVFERLLSAVAPGGTIVCQVAVSSSSLSWLFNRAINLPVAGNLCNLLRRRPWSYPSMQMNGYRLERLLAPLARRGYASSTVTYGLSARAWLPDSALIVAKRPNVADEGVTT